MESNIHGSCRLITKQSGTTLDIFEGCSIWETRQLEIPHTTQANTQATHVATCHTMLVKIVKRSAILYLVEYRAHLQLSPVVYAVFHPITSHW